MASIYNYFVYILACPDQTYYTGVTNDLEIRLSQHHSGENPLSYTYSRRPLILRYHQRFDFIEHAIEFETS